MKVYLTALGIVSALMLAGCMATTPKAMMLDPKVKKKHVIVDQNYQELYKRALEKSKECHEMGLITAAYIADGQIYTDIKEAEVSIYLMGGFGRQMHHTTTFKALDSNKSDMNVYSYWGDALTDILSREYTGECVSCMCKEENKILKDKK